MFFNQQRFRSLICENVPDDFNTERCLKIHFSQFGTVHGVVSSPRKKLAKVVFQTASDAASAKRNGAVIEGSYEQMKLYYADDNRISRATKNKSATNLHQEKFSSPLSYKEPASENYGFNFKATERPTRRSISNVSNSSEDTRLMYDLDSNSRSQANLSPTKRFASRRSWDKKQMSRNSNDTLVIELKNGNLRSSSSISAPQSPSTEFDDGTIRYRDFRAKNNSMAQTSVRRARSNLLKRALNRPKARSNSIMARAAMKDLDHPGEFSSDVEKPAVFGKTRYGAGHFGKQNIFGVKKTFELHDEDENLRHSSFGSIFERATGTSEKDDKCPTSLKRPFGNVNTVESISLPSKRVSWKEDSAGSVSGIPKVEDVKSTSTAKKISWLKGRDDSLRKSSGNDCHNLKGTCDDMCPELEVHIRQSTNRVDYYETDPSTGEAEESKFVKEYTRSSADKENPLPHEVRSITGLNLSMNYLMDSVMNDFDLKRSSPSFNVGVWFNFLWNRTRSIRNDITIQNLHTVESVELIEKIARFHIVCGYELRSAQYHDFDPKVNDEHYSKSIQTLKHMYYDLRKKDIACSNEAEFRAYEVLKNLADCGTTMLEAKNFPLYVWSNPKFKVALKLYRAFASGNYVSFLKIFHNGADYLMSCILYKYLDNCRVTIINSLSVACGSSRNVYSAEEVGKILQFRQTDKALDYMERLGFEVDRNAENVELKKLLSIDPLESLEDDGVKDVKDNFLVDCKKIVTFGEIVNNGATDQNYKNYTPKSSFMESNFGATMRDVTSHGIDQTDDGIPSEMTESTININEGSVEQLVDYFIHEEVEIQCRNMIKEIVGKYETWRAIVAEIYDEVENSTLLQEVQNLIIETINDRNTKLFNILEITFDILMSDLIAEEFKSFLRDERNTMMKEQTNLTICADITDSVLNEVVWEMSRKTAEEILVGAFRYRNDKRVKSGMFVSWKRATNQKIKRRFLRQNFPAVVGQEKSAKYSFDFNLKQQLDAGMEVGNTRNILEKMAAHHLSETYRVNDLVDGIFSNFVHMAILDVSQNEDIFKVFASKLQGIVQFSVSKSTHSFNVLRFELSCHKSYVCVTVVDSCSFEKHINLFKPNILIVFDPLTALEWQWVENIASENESCFSTFYVTASNKEAKKVTSESLNESMMKFELNLATFGSLLQFHRLIFDHLKVEISKRSKECQMPKKTNLSSFIRGEFRNWFCLLLDSSLQKKAANIFKQLSLEWLLELYSCFMKQIRQFLVGNRMDFPLPIFSGVVSEAAVVDIDAIFDSLTHLTNFRLCQKVAACSSWIECLDVLEQVINVLPLSTSLKHDLAAKCQHILNDAIAAFDSCSSEESDSNESVVFDSAEDFPWTQLTMQIMSFTVDNISCENMNTFLSCSDSDFVFQRPHCWSLFLQSVYAAKRVSSYFVNDTLVLTC